MTFVCYCWCVLIVHSSFGSRAQFASVADNLGSFPVPTSVLRHAPSGGGVGRRETARRGRGGRLR